MIGTVDKRTKQILDAYYAATGSASPVTVSEYLELRKVAVEELKAGFCDDCEITNIEDDVKLHAVEGNHSAKEHPERFCYKKVNQSSIKKVTDKQVKEDNHSETTKEASEDDNRFWNDEEESDNSEEEQDPFEILKNMKDVWN